MSAPLTLPGPLVLLGAGKMGGAMLRGWLAAGADPAQIVILDPALGAGMAADARAAGVTVNPTLPEAEALAPRVLVLAVKPQMMAEAVAPLRGLAATKPLVVSIAAGKTVTDIATLLGDAPIVRAMPNTPASVGRGITAAFAGPGVDAAQRRLAGDLLGAVGGVVWLDDEDLMDAVTAVSGSGPAYVFFLTECLAAAARDVGLPEGLAARLARATVAGAGELLHQASEPASVLRENVTSPGGTTAAALEVLMAQDALKPLIARAVTAARDRARDLSG